MPTPHQTAELHLRGSAPIRVTWTAATAAGPLPLVVHLGREPRIADPAVVLAVTGFDDGLAALEWCADHGAELGGDPRRLIVAGDHSAAGQVAALARHARDRGWPPIERTVVPSHRGGLLTITESYFAIARSIDASRERVFRMWTDPQELSRWYRGDPFDYLEVDAPARIELTRGEPELLIVTLSEVGDHTVMTFEGSAPADEAEDAEQAWHAMLDWLALLAEKSSS